MEKENLFFVTKEGKAVSPICEETVPDIGNINNFPVSTNFQNFSDYKKNIAKWTVSTSFLTKNLLSNSITTSFLRRPLITKKIIHNNFYSIGPNQILELEEIVLGKNTQPKENFSQKYGYSKKSTPISLFLHSNDDWIVKSFPQEPKPEFFDTYEEYEKSFMKWIDITKNTLSPELLNKIYTPKEMGTKLHLNIIESHSQPSNNNITVNQSTMRNENTYVSEKQECNGTLSNDHNEFFEKVKGQTFSLTEIKLKPENYLFQPEFHCDPNPNAVNLEESIKFGPSLETLPINFNQITSKQYDINDMQLKDLLKYLSINPERLSNEQRIKTLAYFTNLLEMDYTSVANNIYNHTGLFSNLLHVMKYFGRMGTIVKIDFNELNKIPPSKDNNIIFTAASTLFQWHYTQLLNECYTNLGFKNESLQTQVSFVNNIISMFFISFRENLRVWLQNNLKKEYIHIITSILRVILRCENPNAQILISTLRPSFFDYLNQICNISEEDFKTIVSDIILEDYAAQICMQQIQTFLFGGGNPVKDIFYNGIGYLIKCRGRVTKNENLGIKRSSWIIQPLSVIVQVILSNPSQPAFFALDRFLKLIRLLYLYGNFNKTEWDEIYPRILGTVEMLFVNTKNKPIELYNSIASLCMCKEFMSYYFGQEALLISFLQIPFPRVFWRFLFNIFAINQQLLYNLLQKNSVQAHVVHLILNSDIKGFSYMVKSIGLMIETSIPEESNSDSRIFMKPTIPSSISELFSIIKLAEVDLLYIIKTIENPRNLGVLGNKVNSFYYFSYLLKKRPFLMSLFHKHRQRFASFHYSRSNKSII